MTGDLILVGLALAFCAGSIVWARWSGRRVERNDPARRSRPAE